jgi:hypothetical protein
VKSEHAHSCNMSLILTICAIAHSIGQHTCGQDSLFQLGAEQTARLGIGGSHAGKPLAIMLREDRQQPGVSHSGRTHEDRGLGIGRAGCSAHLVLTVSAVAKPICERRARDLPPISALKERCLVRHATGAECLVSHAQPIPSGP